MKTLLLVSLACTRLANAQASANWNTYAGDPQHSGWERTDPAISKDTVKDLQLLWKMKLDTQPKGLQPILPPLIMGRLISYRGFKELAFVGTNSDIVYAIDADLGKLFWQKHLEYAALDPPATTSTLSCPGGLTAIPTMPPPVGRGGGRGAAPAAPAPPVGRSGFIGGGGPVSVYAISSDGRLHRLNVSTGDDIVQPVSVLPPNAHVYNLNMNDNVIYAITGQDCNGAASAIWAIDLSGDALKVTSLAMTGGTGPVIGTDGTLYVQTASSLLALSPRDLQVKQSFDIAGNTASPLLFAYKDRDVIVTAGKDGRLYLLDSTSLAAPLYKTAPLTAADGGIPGGLSSWESNGTRWVLAPVTSAAGGSIAAFKVEEQSGKPVLSPAWVSRDMNSPQPPVIASGVVFALSAGEFTGPDRRPKSGTRATLYALDANTGKELYSSRNLVNGPASLAGITIANGRVYFGTLDGTFYAFGMYMEH
jgi:outer membrane protein assembly factor BamB